MRITFIFKLETALAFQFRLGFLHSRFLLPVWSYSVSTCPKNGLPELRQDRFTVRIALLSSLEAEIIHFLGVLAAILDFPIPFLPLWLYSVDTCLNARSRKHRCGPRNPAAC